MNQSLKNLAHAPTAQLSWHVQNLIAIACIKIESPLNFQQIWTVNEKDKVKQAHHVYFNLKNHLSFWKKQTFRNCLSIDRGRGIIW